MVVDDDPEIGRIVTSLLCKHNHNHGVISFTGGKGALAYLKNDISCPDERRVKLLLTDIEMSEMTGLELLRQAKTLYPGLPVIVMSGAGEGRDRDEIFSLGADFIPKPFGLVDLLARINSACRPVAQG